jgi:hypothetical protein
MRPNFFSEKPQSGHSPPWMDAGEQSLLDRVLTRAGYNPDDVPRLHRRCDYSQRVTKLEPVFTILSQPALPDGFIKVLAKKMRVPKPTIANWRRLLLRDPTWRPGSGYGHGRRLLTDEEENGLTNRKVAVEFIRRISKLVRRQQLCFLWDSFSAQRDEDVRREAGGLDIAMKTCEKTCRIADAHRSGKDGQEFRVSRGLQKTRFQSGGCSGKESSQP